MPPLILDGTTGISGVDGTAGTPAAQGTDSNTGVFYATDIVGISTGGTERMRVNSSGNVGIGTNSPSTPLEVSGTITATSVNTNNTFGFKNRIINGAMVIDQRNAGAAVTANSSFPVDRFQINNSTDGSFSAQRDSSAPAGFSFSTKFTTTTADATLTTTQNLAYFTRIEGFNTADFSFGTANAKTVTLSFWVRSSLTGTFGGSFTNSDNNRSYPFTYTISVADTWEQKSVTITGDTSGTWVGATNGVGLRVNFGLGAGPDRSGTAGAWNSNTNVSATGAVSVIGTLNATWYITGVQLEVGSTATSFDYRPYGTELALCQRYYERYALGANTIICPMQCYSTSAAFGGPIKYTVTKRATPTITLPTAGSGSGEAALSTSTGSFPGTIGTHSISGETVDMARVNATGYTSAFTAGDASMYLSTNSGTAVIQISAEL